MAKAKKTREAEALEKAKELASQGLGWMAMHNALFGIGGLCGQLFATVEERTAFTDTPEYKEIMTLVDAAGGYGGPATDATGKMILRLPKSLHAALRQEAEHEGVSLNTLVISKLSTQLAAVASSR